MDETTETAAETGSGSRGKSCGASTPTVNSRSCKRTGPRRSRVVRSAALALAIGVLAVSFGGVVQAEEEYDPKLAGNPLRLAAYVLHPVGVILDYVIFRPTYWLFSHEPLSTLVGRDD